MLFIEKQMRVQKIEIQKFFLKTSSPFTPLLGELLLEKDVEDEGVRHQSPKKEEDASWNGQQYLMK